ncbi:hypothetical protein DUZ99_08590 [Xylanibacillus composti]|uniref:Uncharacterized protein n=1 Tax=Xylanibacillus composti TaxID=1572762 RepID=A0A8J4GYD5_9BACL|nr:hypothetical protein [Xylanibacillus composti]MDT9725052.1 hypothetical protein [Xylanibacillus composti]GIQ67468.1 hypothetical protein XYCOK13_02920 [Xylanibacillus composti]
MVNKWLAAGLAVLLMASGGGMSLAANPDHSTEGHNHAEHEGHGHAHAHGWPHKKEKKSEHFELMMQVMEKKEALFEQTLIAAEKGNIRGIQAVKGYHDELKKLSAANKELGQKLMAEREALLQAKKKEDKKAVQAHMKEMKKLVENMHGNLKATSDLLDKAAEALR